MASLVSNLSFTVSRLILSRKPPLHYSINTLHNFHGHRKLSKLKLPFLHASTNNVSFSSCPKSQTVNALDQDEELVVLGIETSCDDTAAAVVRSNGEILSQVVSSQAELLVQYGGVAPKMAEEAHSQVIDQVVQDALVKAKVTEEDLSAVAVTIGPGLSLCLRVGVRKARKLAGAYALPIIGVHHMEAHALVASDASVPIALASSEDIRARADIAASFQRVAVLHLEDKCERAVEWGLNIEPSLKYLVVSGGVASNQYVRCRLNKIVEKKGLHLVCPPPSLCTDNGVMIAWTGIEHFRMGRYDPPPPPCEPEDALLDLRPRWPLGEEYAQGRSEARSLRTARVHPSLTSLIRSSIQQPS